MDLGGSGENMNSVPVVWLSYKDDVPARGYWDQGLLEDLFNKKLWNPVGGYDFDQVYSLEGIEDGAVIVYPSKSQGVEELNEAIKNLKWVVLMLTGDEESEFPVEKVSHGNIRIWSIYPRPGRHDQYHRLGAGYPPQTREYLPKFKDQYDNKTTDIFFAGQITHVRRQLLRDKLLGMRESYPELAMEYEFSEGFTQGLPPEQYYQSVANAKVVVCPSGAETPDTFRIYEALEAGCIPIADTRDPKGVFPDNYWQFFFEGDVPFPVLTDYEQLPGYTLDVLENWKANSNRIYSWWQMKKREMAYKLVDDIDQLRNSKNSTDSLLDNITIIIPSSPIRDHPSTEMIEQTIRDIRAQLPNCEILITVDGIRAEQARRRTNYEEYKRRLLWLSNFEWSNVLPIIYDNHMHQAKMARDVMKHVKTPCLLYVEHDTSLLPEREYEWDKQIQMVLSGQANLIRFHHEESVLPEHEYLMMSDTEEHFGTQFRKTQQWSQRPHLASVVFYRRIIQDYFNPESITMIEDVLHGSLQDSCHVDGMMGWYNWRVWMYTPQNQGIKRSSTVDGRGNDPKYEMIILPTER